MSHCDHHHASPNTDGRRLLAALAITIIFMVVEIVGSFLSGSLALLADAVHMSTDAFALALAASAVWLSKRPADGKLHFGYRRVQVLSGFVNGLLMLLLICWIIVEAVQRFLNPEPVIWSTMLVVAILGLAANGVAFAVLTVGNSDNINIRGAVLHVMGDLLGSAAAVVAALVIMATGWLRVDPLLSVFVALLIGRSALRLVKDTSHILLEGAPDNIDKNQLIRALKESLPEIDDVHKVQIWQITPEHPRLTMHVAVAHPDAAAGTLAKIKSFLEDNYNSLQSTIQIELKNHCPDIAFVQADEPHHGHLPGPAIAAQTPDTALSEQETVPSRATTIH